MKKSYIFILLAIILILFLIWFFGYSNMKKNNQNNTLPQNKNQTSQNINNETNSKNSIAQRVTVQLNSTNDQNLNKKNSSNNNNNLSNSSNALENSIKDMGNINKEENTGTNQNGNQSKNQEANDNNSKNSETELSSFSTDILTSDPNRNNNIHLTCSTLNEHIVSPGEIFSFTGLIGKSTTDKGYKKANVIASDGDTIKGLGGGNCQVSSTLYNAVAKVSELEVIERHNHGSEVYYVPLGQDAAVAYGSVDFKFKNNFDTDIKIYASTDDKKVTIRITKMPS